MHKNETFEELLERAKDILSQEELDRFRRILNQRKDVAEPGPVKTMVDLDVGVKLEIARKEHELALRKRGEELHEKVLGFEKKRAAINNERNAKLKKQQEERDKRISDIRHKESAVEESGALKANDKLNAAALRRNRIRDGIIENARTQKYRLKPSLNESGILVETTSSESLHSLSKQPAKIVSVKREKTIGKPNITSSSKTAHNVVTIELEARNLELLEKFKSRDEQVQRNKAELRQRLQDKSRKLDERCQKNLRSASDSAKDKMHKDLERYMKRHVHKNRLALREEKTKHMITSFVQRRSKLSKSWALNREKLNREQIIRHDLRLHEILKMHQRSPKHSVVDDTRRINRMRVKARRKPILHRIRRVKNSDELEKVKQKLTTVEIL
jgi:hypothetical protein